MLFWDKKKQTFLQKKEFSATLGDRPTRMFFMESMILQRKAVTESKEKLDK